MDKRSLISAYLRQQKDLAMPDAVVGPGISIKQSIAALAPRTAKVPEPAKPVSSSVKVPVFRGAVTPAGKLPAANPLDRLSKLSRMSNRIVEPLPPYGKDNVAPAPAAAPSSSFEQKRAALKELFLARCSACSLSEKRKSFVFGSGNVDAPLMIIGEAPGAEEDAKGLPFVGAAGQLLTTMLSAVAIDRKKDVFITNVLKCRPPENRNPESAEVLACMPLLEKQIDIIQPKLLLLLGRVAAHALLGVADSVAKLRAKTHEYRGIPALVTYHPAALLRSAEYMRPAEEDLQQAARMIKEGDTHAPA